MLKSAVELKKLPSDSRDIYKKGALDRYIERPTELESFCLADFLALFSFKSKGKPSNGEDEPTLDQGDGENNGTIEDLIADTGENSNEKKVYQLTDGTLQRRRKSKVIRFCRFDFHKNPKNFFRERFMLFKPWRNEAEELQNPPQDDFQKLY